jgi:hypothetical protein
MAKRLFRKSIWEAFPRPCAFRASARLKAGILATPLLARELGKPPRPSGDFLF